MLDENQNLTTGKKYQNLLVSYFFIFLSAFPSIRVLILGTRQSETIAEYFFSSLPELFFCGIVFYYFVKKPFKEIGKAHLLDYLLLFYLAFNLIVGFSIAQDLKVSIYATRLSYLPMILYFISNFKLVEISWLERNVAIVFKLFLGICIIGILLYFVFPSLQNYFLKLTNDEIQEYFIVRMTSILWTPVVFGTIVCTSILYFSYLYIQNKKLINLVYLAIFFICLFMSVSRGAIVTIIFGLLILLLLSRNWKEFLIIILLKISVFTTVAYYISNPKDFLLWIMTSTGDTLKMEEGVTRVELWNKALHTAIENPFGLGLGKAGHVATRFFKDGESKVSIASTDGWFLKLLNETGFIGLGLYLLFCALIVFYFIRYYLRNKFDFISVLFAIFAIINVQNIVSNVLDFYLFAYFYWFIIGIMVFYITDKNLKNG